MAYGPQEEKRDRELSRKVKVFSGLPDPKASALKWSIIPILFVFYQLSSTGPKIRWRDASDSVGVEIGFFGLIIKTIPIAILFFSVAYHFCDKKRLEKFRRRFKELGGGLIHMGEDDNSWTNWRF